MRKISSKIVAAIIACSFTISLILGTVSILKSTEFIKKEAVEKLVFMSESHANKCSEIFNGYDATLKTVVSGAVAAFDLEKFDYGNVEYLDEFEKDMDFVIKQVAQTSEGVQGVYFTINPELGWAGKVHEIWYVDEGGDGTFERRDSDQDGSYIEWFTPDNEDMAWYYEAIEEGKSSWSDPYEEVALNNLSVVSHITPVYKDGVLLGVMGMDIKVNNLKDTIENIKVYDTGYAFLLNSKFDVLIHPSFNEKDNFKTVHNGALECITEEMEKNNSGFIEYEFEGEDKILGFSHLYNGWIVAMAPPANEIFAPVKSFTVLLAILIVLGIIISCIVAMYMGRVIVKPILNTTELANKTANLDLAYDSSYEILLKYKDETGIIAKSLFDARKEFRKLIASIKGNSENIDSQSQSLSAVADEMASASGNVSSAVQESAAGIVSQAQDLVDITNALNQFGCELTSIVKSIREVDLSAKGAQTQASSSVDKMQALVESVGKVSDSFGGFVSRASSLGENINQINHITNIINSIAGQTNLLALNASIEAARAGEYGSGFSVVAGEIRNLAEQSKASAESINKLVKTISNDMDMMLKTTDILDSEFSNQAEVINSATDSFKQIIEGVEAVVPEIEAIDIAASKLDGQNGAILEKITDASSVAQEVSASSEEIAASSEEVSASTEEVASSAQALNSMTKEMMEQVNRFKL